MIERFYTTEFTIKRQVWTSDKSSLVAQGTFMGHIQQGTSENYQESLAFKFTKAHTVWCAVGTDIAEGDRIEEGADKYDVHFVIDRDIRVNEVNDHLHVIVEKIDG